MLRDEVLRDVGAGALEGGVDFGAEAHHPRAGVFEGEGGEGDDELLEIVRGIEHFHRGADGVLVVVDENDVGVANVLQIKLNDFVGAIHFAIFEVAAHGIEQREVLGEQLLGALTPSARMALVFIHDGTAEIDSFFH